MYYVGMDVHLQRSSLAVLDQNGGLVRRLEVKGPWSAVLEKVRELPRPFAICYEASCGYGYLHEKLSNLAERVAVAHPGQLRLIFRAKKKNDRVDAGKLAKLLYLDEVPEVYVPGADVRAWRALIEYRRKVTSKVVKIKNQIRALLRGLGIPAVRGLWKPRGMEWLQGQPLPAGDHLRRELMLEELAELQAKLGRVDQELARRGGAHPGVMLLQTIPGIGPRTAEAVVAYVDNIRRFGRTHHRAIACSFLAAVSESGMRVGGRDLTDEPPWRPRKPRQDFYMRLPWDASGGQLLWNGALPGCQC